VSQGDRWSLSQKVDDNSCPEGLLKCVTTSVGDIVPWVPRYDGGLPVSTAVSAAVLAARMGSPPPILAFLILAQIPMSKRLVIDDPTAMRDWLALVDTEGLAGATQLYNWTHYKALACRLADRVTALEKQLDTRQT